VDREYFAILFYSVHELQRMIDEAKAENGNAGCGMRFDD
jgi:hypothetical protein